MLGQRLRRFREFRGLSQEDLANRVGTTQRTISAWENGQTPAGDYIARLAEALETSADYILGLTDDPRPPDGDTNLSDREWAVINSMRRGDLVEAMRALVAPN